MEAVNYAIQQLEAKSVRYFDKEKLPKRVTVWRYGAHALGGIGMSVATLLLVATKEPPFCALIYDLASMGRPPKPGKPLSLVAAACHDFETAALEDPEVLVSEVLERATAPEDEEATVTFTRMPSPRENPTPSAEL